ncbi:MAG TPA: 30S ribosomal protein S16 [Patescibacteria group bacterium]|nr:30S ribosomal protein S16 [Patescibacteria group bacterium]
MLKIRLSRKGAKNVLFYRIIAIDEMKKRGGKAVDIVGTWDPIKKIKKIDLKKVDYWVAKGAVVTPAVKKLI